MKRYLIAFALLVACKSSNAQLSGNPDASTRADASLTSSMRDGSTRQDADVEGNLDSDAGNTENVEIDGGEIEVVESDAGRPSLLDAHATWCDSWTFCDDNCELDEENIYDARGIGCDAELIDLMLCTARKAITDECDALWEDQDDLCPASYDAFSDCIDRVCEEASSSIAYCSN